MFKLIALDLDGTLLNDDKIIPRENLNTINELIKRGYEIVIATGRRYWSAKNLTNQIEGHLTILANNGNVLRRTENDQLLFAKYLDLNYFKIAMEEGKKRNLHPIIHVDGYDEGIDIIIEFDREHKSYNNYLSDDSRYKQIENYLDINDDRILALVYSGLKKDLDSFHEFLYENYPMNYNAHVMENIQLAEALLEIMHPRGSKWLSLEEYAKSKNIKAEEIIAMGDDNNDIDMIENVGLGIAMKNGSNSVKSVAKMISQKDNNESGVAFELKRVLNI